MSEEKPPSNPKIRKTWTERIGQWFQGEPKNHEELADVISEAKQRDVITEDTKEMIQGVLDVTNLKVRDIMIPRSQIIAIPKNLSIPAILDIVIQSAHSRFPVIHDDKDHIEGILLAKDLLRYGFQNQPDNFSLDMVLRPAVVVPESKRVDVLLKEFRSNRYHMAMVIDEYGGVSGLVTIEDILEEIVGEIEDEFAHDDKSMNNIRKSQKDQFIIDALTPIEEFNLFFGAQLSDQEFDTIGGLVSHAFGHLPQQGENIQIKDFQFIVLKSNTRKIIELKIQTLKAT